MTKYAIRLILYKHQKNKQGLYAIYLRITINRKTSYKATGHFINEKMWDEKKEMVRSAHPDADIINAHLIFTKQEFEKKLVTAQIKGIDYTASALKKSFSSDDHNIFTYVENLIVKLKGKKSESTLKNYSSHLKRLEAFAGRNILFENIDVKLLRDYEAWLRENIKHTKKSEHKNYLHAIWKTLKTWFNAARHEGIITHYPFDNYENPKYVVPDKDFLTLDELKLFEDFANTTSNDILKQVAVYFLFGCYSGLRISDWHQFNQDKHLLGDKIRIRPIKTKHKWVEMIVSAPLQRILMMMKEIPLTLAEATMNEKVKIIAGELDIKKHLTIHSSRHTFAVTICLGNGLSSETAAKLMAITLATFVANYSKVTQEKIDAETSVAWKNLR